MTDDQLGFDIPIETSAEKTPWQEWVDPDRQDRQARAFLRRAELGPLPPTPWERYGDDMGITKLNDVVYELFPTVEAVSAPSNREIADELVCLIGAWFAKYRGAEWVDVAGLPPGTYADTTAFHLYRDFRPALAFTDFGPRTFTAEFLVDHIIGGGREFFDIAVDIDHL
ncbi:hypothetical protein [Nocardia wallacei]|uniref:hypothetical protein n=1 Tax=Nocardia wallacei TaxID=480035 RepID=UPI002458D59C|nr:hypothetical protein [Nocardia wallacei]